MTFRKWKVFYSDKEHYLKLYAKITWHNNLTMLFAEVSKFPSSLDLAFEINFLKLRGRLCGEIYDNILYNSWQWLIIILGLSNYSFSLNDG